MTIREVLLKGSQIISSRWKETPFLDSSVILQSILNISKERLFASFPDPVSQADLIKFMSAAKARAEGDPVAYITGHKEFFGLDFHVNRNVFIPRADTETVAEALVELVEKSGEKRILDLCTGSGCIAISVKHACPHADVCASDISEEALALFKKNSHDILGFTLKTFKSALFENIEGEFDIIVSNPPYLTEEETSKMKKEGWPEPETALDGGKDGLDFIRAITKGSRKYLKDRGYLIFEADPFQMKSISEELKKNSFSDIMIKKDIAGRDRAIIGRADYGKD